MQCCLSVLVCTVYVIAVNLGPFTDWCVTIAARPSGAALWTTVDCVLTCDALGALCVHVCSPIFDGMYDYCSLYSGGSIGPDAHHAPAPEAASRGCDRPPHPPCLLTRLCLLHAYARHCAN